MRKAVTTGWGKSPKSHRIKEVAALSHKRSVKKSKTATKNYFKSKSTIIGNVSGAGVRGITNA